MYQLVAVVDVQLARRWELRLRLGPVAAACDEAGLARASRFDLIDALCLLLNNIIDSSN